MVVSGERYMLFSFFMNALCLFSPAYVLKRKVHTLRVLLSAFSFALLGMVQMLLSAQFAHFFLLLLLPFFMTFCAFGKRELLKLFVLVLLFSMLFLGVCLFLYRFRAPPVCSISVCVFVPLAFSLFMLHEKAQIALTVRIVVDKQTFHIKGILDTGNCLADDTGPVIVLPKKELADYIHTHDCALRGFQLLPVQTALGSGVLPAFYPDLITVTHHNTTYILKTTRIALSKGGTCALVPPTLIQKEV